MGSGAGKPTSTPTEGSMEERFDADFNFFNDITITPRQAGDFERAVKLQDFYRSAGDRIKAFVTQEKERSYLQGRNDAVDDVLMEIPRSPEKVICRGEDFERFCEAARSPKP